MTEPTWKGDGLNQQAREEYWKGKTRFWENLAFKYLPEMRLLFKGGKLWNKNQQAWRNVVEHDLVEAAVAGVLAEQLHCLRLTGKGLLKQPCVSIGINGWRKWAGTLLMKNV